MDNKINCTNKGGKKPHAHFLPMMALVLFGMIALVGVAAADDFYPGMPPVTKLSSAINGTVNGDVDVIMAKDPWNPDASVTYGRNAQYNWGNLTLAVRPDLVDLKFEIICSGIWWKSNCSRNCLQRKCECWNVSGKYDRLQ